jgi:hypothetical protein
MSVNSMKGHTANSLFFFSTIRPSSEQLQIQQLPICKYSDIGNVNNLL